jgi:hypothetical protein
MEVSYPICIVADPGNVFNVARFPLGSSSFSSSSSSSTSTSATSSPDAIFQNANISLEEMNVGEDGKAAEEGEKNSSDDEEAEEAKAMAAQQKPAFNRRAKIPLMRKARERKFILKDDQGQEKFSGIVDGATSDETFACFFHPKHQKFYLVPLEKAYKFTKSHETTVTYEDAMEKLGAGTYADQRYNQFQTKLREGGGMRRDEQEEQEDTSSSAQTAAKSLFASRYGLGTASGGGRNGERGKGKNVASGSNENDDGGGQGGGDEDVWNEATDRVSYATEQGADVEVDRSDDDYEQDDERFDSNNIDVEDSDEEYRFDDEIEQERKRNGDHHDHKGDAKTSNDDNGASSSSSSSASHAMDDEEVDVDDLKAQAGYGRHSSKYKKRGREEDMEGTAVNNGEDDDSLPPTSKRARIEQSGGGGGGGMAKAKKKKAMLSASGMRSLVEGKGGRITDRELILAYTHKLNPKREGHAKNGKVFTQLVSALLNKTVTANGEKYFELK